MGTRPRVVIAGLGDTGALVATRLVGAFEVVGISTRPALVSGQELGTRLTAPNAWARTYFVPFSRFRRLDAMRLVHGRVTGADLDRRAVTVELADGTTTTEHYDALVIATGVSNGFWRHDRIEDSPAISDDLATAASRLQQAPVVAVIGGGASGVSVADNLARRGHRGVHLFITGDLPLPEHHERARAWIDERLREHGVTVHRHHRAVVPNPAPDDITTGPIRWTTGQPPVEADAVVWAVGGAHPHSAFLPADVLDDDGFVRVDEHLRVVGHPEVFAVGDVAASDPLRSSARNWGWRVVAANARATLRGRGRLRRFRPQRHRWGSIVGLQDDGLVVVRPDGSPSRIPRRLAELAIYRGFIPRYLYGGLRRER